MKFELKGEYIALCDLLKTVGIAQSGGQGKVFVATDKDLKQADGDFGIGFRCFKHIFIGFPTSIHRHPHPMS